jgi:hypothetical protein
LAFIRWSLYGFYEASLRVERAGKHLKELEAVLDTARDAYDEPILDEYEVNEGIEPLGILDPSEIQVIIGDFIHNLRSALNYIAITLVRHDSPDVKISHQHQFPIESCEKVFLRHSKTYLKGVRDDHVALIKRVQPYNGCEWAKLLVTFSNTDKHVELVSVTLNVSTSIHVLDTDTVEAPQVGGVNMYRVSEHEVTLADGTSIIEALQEIQTQVAQLLEEFNSCLADERDAKVAAQKKVIK